MPDYTENEGPTYLGPWIKIARSFVIFPDSTVSTHEASNLRTKSSNFSFSSNLALKQTGLAENQVLDQNLGKKKEWRERILMKFDH